MNVGVIGSGFIVDVFVRNSKKIKDFKLYGIWGRHEEKIKNFEGFKLYTTDINELLNDPNIDVVYVALPNSLHYEYAYKALKAGKHVMLEKPFCTSVSQAKTLINYAKKHNLILYETAMTPHSRNYQKAKKYIKDIGEIKMVDVNFSQYSRRYEKFKNGTILPAFDYKLAGGALLDLGVYSVHYVVGMFGLPKKTMYFPNVLKNVDTSGVLILDYGKFKANIVSCKDTEAPGYALIQGDKGFIRCNSKPSRCASFDIVMNNGKTVSFETSNNEFVGWETLYKDFLKLYKNKDLKAFYDLLEETLGVQKVLDDARKFANMKY